MGKKAAPLFILLIVAAIFISAWPDIKKSRNPVNQFISSAKKSGMIPLVQVAASQAQADMAVNEIQTFNLSSQTKIIGKTFPAAENTDFLEEYGLGKSGYVIFDADGKPAVQAKGTVTSVRLAKIISGVHTHE